MDHPRPLCDFLQSKKVYKIHYITLLSKETEIMNQERFHIKLNKNQSDSGGPRATIK